MLTDEQARRIIDEATQKAFAGDWASSLDNLLNLKRAGCGASVNVELLGAFRIVCKLTCDKILEEKLVIGARNFLNLYYPCLLREGLVTDDSNKNNELSVLSDDSLEKIQELASMQVTFVEKAK